MKPSSFPLVMFTMGHKPIIIPSSAQIRRDADMVFDLPGSASAHSLRTTWMRRMGLGEDEILESLQNDPPTSVAEEMKQIRALDKLDRITPSNDVWQKVAVKY